MVFTDILGSTALVTERGDGYRRLLADYRRQVRAIAGSHAEWRWITQGRRLFPGVFGGRPTLFRPQARSFRAAWEFWSCIASVGVGAAFASIPNLIVVAVDEHQTGEATGVNTIMRNIGSAVGAQIAGSIIAHVLANGICRHRRQSARPPLLPGMGCRFPRAICQKRAPPATTDPVEQPRTTRRRSVLPARTVVPGCAPGNRRTLPAIWRRAARRHSGTTLMPTRRANGSTLTTGRRPRPQRAIRKRPVVILMWSGNPSP